MLKETLSIIAIILTFIAFLPYIRAIKQKKIKPHVFSWIIWGVTTLVVFFAQLTDHAGVGAWPIGFSALITLYVAVLAYKGKADTIITLSDWFFFTLAMSSLPLWYITTNPLWAVIILTFTDVVGFAPTFRKAYTSPFDEQLTFFVLITIRNAIVLVALEHYSLTTTLFPAAIALACTVFIILVLLRRNILSQQKP
jgi:hypothetical protein